MKVLITDAMYKHAVALARYLRQFDRSLVLVGVDSTRPRYLTRLLRTWYSSIRVGDLTSILDGEDYDLVIPVSARSVRITSQHPTAKKVLPAWPAIETCLDKRQTAQLCQKLNVPHPCTHLLSDIGDVESLTVEFPCVVKGAWEAGKNVVEYVGNRAELLSSVRRAAEDGSQFSTLPVVQEYVHGVGAGFFAFYQHGTLKRWYIHRRLRESPPTGGSSTAAETCYYPEIYELGKRMLDHLQWHGVAMVEFKLDERTGKVHLMEVNPKFWGSLELGLAAGVNFGELLVRTIRGEEIQAILSPDAYKRLRFFWPFDGDVANIVSQGNYRALLEYFRSDARTNLRTYGLVRALARIRHLPRAIFSLRRTRMRGSFAK